MSRTQGLIAGGRIKSIGKFDDLIEDRTCDLPACSVLPRPATLLLASVYTLL
jgi:hypothetical protein